MFIPVLVKVIILLFAYCVRKVNIKNVLIFIAFYVFEINDLENVIILSSFYLRTDVAFKLFAFI